MSTPPSQVSSSHGSRLDLLNTTNMAIRFETTAKPRIERSNSTVDLQKFNSAAPTLNNTPTGSRSNSPVRRRLSTRSPTPSPTDGDLEAMNNGRPIRALDAYCNEELDISWMGTIVIACFFTSGMIDAVAFNSWNCFVGMQTGNTIFAALGLGGLPTTAHPHQFIKSAVAIVSFCLGALFFNFIHRFPTNIAEPTTLRHRGVFALSFLIQAILIFIAAALVQAGVVSNRPFVIGQFSSGSQRTGEVDIAHRNFMDLIPIIILSFEAAGQVCLSRVLSVIELPTIVLSTLYHDWTADLWGTRQLWRQSNSITDFMLVHGRRQNKRLASIVALFLGGIVGGEMYKTKPQIAGALFFAGALKAVMTIAFVVWRKEPNHDSDVEK